MIRQLPEAARLPTTVMLLAGDGSAEYFELPNFGHRPVTTLAAVFERTTPPHFSRPPENSGSILQAMTGIEEIGTVRCHVVTPLLPVQLSRTALGGDAMSKPGRSSKIVVETVAKTLHVDDMSAV